MHLIKKIKVTTTTDGDKFETHKTEVELYDAQAALVHLGRHHKLFTEKVEVTDLTDKDDSELVSEFNALVEAGAAPSR